MRTPQIVLTIGQDEPALAIPGVSQIRGVLIDNPSGAWLLLRPSNDYIPPYTIGFARSFSAAMASVAVEFPATGPAGQVTTFAGDEPIVVLDSDPVGNNAGVSGGSPFIAQFTPILSSNKIIPITTSLGGGTLLFTAVPNKRYRLWTIDVMLGGFISLPPAQDPIDVGVTYFVNSNPGGTTFVAGRVGPGHVESSHNYPNGLDFPISVGISAVGYVEWGIDTNITVNATASLI